MGFKPASNEIIFSGLISTAAAAVYYYWFGVCDREVLFLYGHLGFRPFDGITTGRYWMTGLVFSAFVSAVYCVSNYLLAFVNRRKNPAYNLPDWLRVWLLTFPPVLVSVPLITMTVNEPVMPFCVSITIGLVLEAGLALGLFTATLLIKDVRWFFVNLADGLGIVPPLILIRVLELPGSGLLKTSSAWFIAGGSMIFTFIWFIATTFFFNRLRIKPGSAAGILGTGFFTAYLALPCVHFLFATPPFSPYITSSSNFFPDSHLMKVATWLAVIIIAASAVHLRRRVVSANRPPRH